MGRDAAICNALYFPHIELPNDAWTAKSLLYWDQVLAIVPRDHLDRPDQMSDFMRELLCEGLVRPVIPAAYIGEVRRFDELFIELIEHRLRRRNIAPGGPLHTVRIHAEKLGKIPHFLIEAGLAKAAEYAWFDVDRATAYDFMCYLATSLGAVPDLNAAPVTNKAAFIQGLRPLQPRAASNPTHRSKSRDVVLRNLLPAPVGAVDLAKLLKFKRDHGHLLPGLRRKVEAHCKRVGELSDAQDRMDLDHDFVHNVQQEIDEIRKAMRPSFGTVVYGALAPIFGAGLSVQGADEGNRVAYAGAALSLVAAAHQAIKSVRGAGRAIANRPVAHLAHAQRVFPKAAE